MHDGGQRPSQSGCRMPAASRVADVAAQGFWYGPHVQSCRSAKRQEKREATPMHDLERRVIGKVMLRLIPFLILCYFVAYLDRVNVSFAKLHMDQALGFSEAAFGLGAGLFFIAYFLFEVPSNIFLERVGARVWIARIMISWGIVSAAFAF